MNKKLIRLRVLFQSLFLFVFVYILWSTTYPLTGQLKPESFFKFDPLITLFTSISERTVISGLASGLLMLFFTLLIGRFFCGWICPLGGCIDLVGSFNKKDQTLTREIDLKQKRFKYYLLSIIVVSAFFGFQILWFFDPITIIARFISLNFIPAVTYFLDAFFVFTLKHLNRPQFLLDFYRHLKTSFLGVHIAYFPHTGFVFLVFSLILVGAFFQKRSWCRFLCPLGALYAVFAKGSFLKRTTDGCISCGNCKNKCPMKAINEDISYERSECILCLDCIYNCPVKVNKFKFTEFLTKKTKSNISLSNKNRKGISRRNFLFLTASGLAGVLLARKAKKYNDYNKVIVRPPASLKEDDFLNRCIRCGNCMKVCVTNGLQPIMFEAGIIASWTPHFVFELGYCEYNCTLCGEVCPTQAIKKLNLKEKHETRLGIAKINRKICLPWAKKKECIVCEEFCPVKNKAIRLKKEKIDGQIVLRPYVEEQLCIGCGVCQTKCPARPARAIKVLPINANRV